jgi:hypothetical protein
MTPQCASILRRYITMGWAPALIGGMGRMAGPLSTAAPSRRPSLLRGRAANRLKLRLGVPDCQPALPADVAVAPP